MKEWLNDLKPGDQVILGSSAHTGVDSIGKVERLTKTQIVIKGSSIRYRRIDGRRIGASCWYESWICQATQEKIAEITEAKKRRTLIGKLNTMRWGDLNTEALAQCLRTAKAN